jgi:tripartite-type tricarboxylate transporter receptor subunit TctC
VAGWAERIPVVRALPDGYTVLLAATPDAINATLYDKLNFNYLRDIAPVAGLVRGPQVMLVNPSVPCRTIPEFVAYAKNNPDKLNMASGGNGTPGHVSGELFKMMSGLEMLHVPYRGEGPALIDLVSGQVQVMFVSMSPSMELIKSRKVIALAVTTAARSEALPDVPTVGDYIPGYEASGWAGIGAPRDTPSSTPSGVASLSGSSPRSKASFAFSRTKRGAATGVGWSRVKKRSGNRA